MTAFLTWPAIKLFFGGILSSFWKALKAFFGALDAQGWIGLIAAALLGFLLIHQCVEARHWHKQSARYEKLYSDDETAAKQIAAHAVALKQQIDALHSSISQTMKEQHDAEATRIDAHADDLSVRGPGKAACPGNPGLPAGTGRHQQTTAAEPASGPRLPATDWGSVPWPWLVQLTREHDELLNEVKTWRENDKRQREAWPKSSK